jgi:hypothetical protein
MFIHAPYEFARDAVAYGSSAWNMFLMTGTPPESTSEIDLTSMYYPYNNCIAALRVTAVNGPTPNFELLTFQDNGLAIALKQHGERIVNGTAGIQCIPQSVITNIPGLDRPGGYVNGFENTGVTVDATTTVVSGLYIEFDFGSPVTLNRILYGNSVTANRNPSTVSFQYWDGSAWVTAASASVNVTNAGGVDTSFTDQLAQRWRVLMNANVTTGFQYRFIRFFASEVPADVQDKSAAVVTWAILVPAKPTVDTSGLSTEIPAILMTAGGPLDTNVAVLSDNQFSIDDFISLIHARVFQAPGETQPVV